MSHKGQEMLGNGTNTLVVVCLSRGEETVISHFGAFWAIFNSLISKTNLSISRSEDCNYLLSGKVLCFFILGPAAATEEEKQTKYTLESWLFIYLF